jgi:hypothetical protein
MFGGKYYQGQGVLLELLWANINFKSHFELGKHSLLFVRLTVSFACAP